MRFRTVLFDFDGTLIDSGAIILASFRHATSTVLAREFPDEQLLALVGGGGLYEQMRALAAERTEELVRAYREHNEPLHSELAAFPGMELLLAELRQQGRRLGIVTAKRRRTVDLAFAVLPLAHLFDTVVTRDDTERTKPDPAPLLLALRNLGAEAGSAAYVGDSPYDIAAAKAAGVHAVAVSWGNIHPPARLEAEEPDTLVHTPAELLDVL